MLVNLELKNIRKFKEKKINFDKKIVIFTGHDGSGKTTILESIFFVSKLKSFKTNEWINVKNNSSKQSYIKATFINDNIKNIINIDIEESKKATINSNKAKISELLAVSRPLVIDSKIMGSFKNNKVERVKFVDSLISSKVRVFPSLLKDFQKLKVALKKVKEEVRFDQTFIESIAMQLSKIEIEIMEKRVQFNNEVLKKFVDNSEKYINKKLRLVYKNIKTSENTYKELMKTSPTTISQDDFDIYLNQDSYTKYASEGEIIFVFLLLTISYIEIVRDEFNQDFPLLLDDIFSELDESNINDLLKILIEKEICAFITTPSVKIIDNKLKIQEIKL